MHNRSLKVENQYFYSHESKRCGSIDCRSDYLVFLRLLCRLSRSESNAGQPMVGRTGFVGTRRARHFSLPVVSKHGRLAKDAQRERLEKCVFKPAGMKVFRQPFGPLPNVVAAHFIFHVYNRFFNIRKIFLRII